MSESVQRDDHRSSFHDMLHFRYEKHRPALHVEGLREEMKTQVQNMLDKGIIRESSLFLFFFFCNK
jgi:hypothetical protein